MFIKRFFTQENVFLAGLGLFCAAYLVQSVGLGRVAAEFPFVVALFALMLVSYMLVTRAIETAKAGGATMAPSAEEKAKTELPPAAKLTKTIPWTLMGLMTLIYAALIVAVGFSLGTVVYLFCVSRMLACPWVKGLIFAVIYTALVIIIFQYGFDVALPTGILWKSLFGL